MWNIPDPIWESTLYFYVWELLACVFVFTDFYLIWRINILEDKIEKLRETLNTR